MGKVISIPAVNSGSNDDKEKKKKSSIDLCHRLTSHCETSCTFVQMQWVDFLSE